MEIVFVFDSNYIKFFRKCIASVKKHNPKANITIVSNEKLDLPYPVITVDLPKNLKHRENDRITDATYIKLMLPEIIKKDKILYMDADIICQGSLKQLWNIECPYICLTESHKYGKVQAKELGHSKYGLSGVMLMNLKALREDNFTQKMFEPFESPVSKWCHEETIINYFYYDKLKFIDKKYNYCHNRIYSNPIRESQAVLLHYCGGKKSKLKMLERRI